MLLFLSFVRSKPARSVSRRDFAILESSRISDPFSPVNLLALLLLGLYSRHATLSAHEVSKGKRCFRSWRDLPDRR